MEFFETDPSFIGPLRKVGTVDRVMVSFPNEVVEGLEGEYFKFDLARKDDDLRMGMDEGFTRILATIGEDDDGAFGGKSLIAFEEDAEDDFRVIRGELMKVSEVVGAINNDFVDVRDGVFVGNYPSEPVGVGVTMDFVVFAPAVNFGRGHEFIAEAEGTGFAVVIAVVFGDTWRFNFFIFGIVRTKSSMSGENYPAVSKGIGDEFGHSR